MPYQNIAKLFCSFLIRIVFSGLETYENMILIYKTPKSILFNFSLQRVVLISSKQKAHIGRTFNLKSKRSLIPNISLKIGLFQKNSEVINILFSASMPGLFPWHKKLLKSNSRILIKEYFPFYLGHRFYEIRIPIYAWVFGYKMKYWK